MRRTLSSSLAWLIFSPVFVAAPSLSLEVNTWLRRVQQAVCQRPSWRSAFSRGRAERRAAEATRAFQRPASRPHWRVVSSTEGGGAGLGDSSGSGGVCAQHTSRLPPPTPLRRTATPAAGRGVERGAEARQGLVASGVGGARALHAMLTCESQAGAMASTLRRRSRSDMPCSNVRRSFARTWTTDALA